MEKDTAANARSRQERRGIQRALGFKNVVIYVLVFVNLLLCSKLFFAWSSSPDKMTGSAAFSTLAAVAGEEPEGGHEGEGASSPEFWIKMALIVALVLIGGVFAGLTIGLMGLDETNLHVLMASGTPTEQVHAETVYKLLSRGKHWVLVTLLLGNVIVNETLPVVLDSELGGGIVAILISTLLIVIFGEIIPQAVCARYGLAIGSYCAKPMLVLMYLMSPVAYPIAMLLDSWLGVHHGTTYRRTELKTLVSLHQMDGIGELTDDEVTIIASVLDLKEKSVKSVMTPLNDVFTLSEDAILDEQLTEEIYKNGHSRIPIHRHDDPNNFIGMLLVKRLITYDPEDHIPVRQLTINSLPQAAPNTSCLDILNFFQEGRSHMAIVTSEPGGFGVPMGVVTLEDVIEELLGEEIVDESDVYVDVHNKIKVIRKPTRNVSMIKTLKTLLQSPNPSEATPLLGNAARASTMPVDNTYMTTGKTILSRKSSSALIDPTTAANTAANAQSTATKPTPVPVADPPTAADNNKHTAAAEAAEATHPFKADSLPKKDIHQNGDKDNHGVNFKDHVEVIKPVAATETASEQETQPERSVTIEVPEATGTNPINSAETIAIADAGKAVEEDKSNGVPLTYAEVASEAPASPASPVDADVPESSSKSSPQVPESTSTSTLLTPNQDQSNVNSPASSSSKKKKNKKKKSGK
ncbi:hypothetical protein EDD11_000192 [Mortierella claussenii]|nr:hypothetical protein EDD11_000192 [Mortierella claussenii]